MADTTGNTKKIGVISALAFSVGTMIGGGVFALSGTVIDEAGSAAILGYVFAGVIMLFSAISFAAVSARAPANKTGYEPIATYLGPVWRFLTMWAFLIMGVALIAFVLVSFASYFLFFVPTLKDASLLISFTALALLMLLNLGSTALVGKAETVMVFFKVLVLLVLIIFGLIAIAPERLISVTGEQPFPESAWYSTAILFTAYTGFNVVTNMSSQIRNPSKNVPLAIMLSLGIVSVVYVLVAVALLMSDVKSFGTAGLAKAAQQLGEPWGFGIALGALVALAACVSTLSGANANVLASAELLVGMAGNRDIPAWMGKLSAHGYPRNSVVIVTLLAVALMVSGAFSTVVVLSNVATVVAMVLVNVTAMRMAVQHWPGAGMRLPLGVTIPVLGTLGALSNLFQYAWWQNLLGLGLVASGLLLYFGMRRTRSLPTSATVHHIRAHLDLNNTPLRRFLSGVPAKRIDPPTSAADRRRTLDS